MYSIQKRDRPLEIHPRRRMRASPEGDESDLTDDSYRHEHATGKAYYYKKKSGVEDTTNTTGKGDNTYDSGGEESSEYSDSDGEGDSEGDDSDGDTSVSDFDGEHSGNSDGEASESTSSVAHPATSSVSPAPDLVKTMTMQKPAAVIATTAISLSEKTNEGTEVPASLTAPELPVTATPTKPTKPPSRVSQSSPQRRQGPMRVVSPPSTAKAKNTFIGPERASKASPSAFSKEM